MDEIQKKALKEAEKKRQALLESIESYGSVLSTDVDLRSKVTELIRVFHSLRSLGVSVVPVDRAVGSLSREAARTRILRYFQEYPLAIIDTEELMVVSGIKDYPRRIRELRVEKGWSIASGYSIKDMMLQDEDEVPEEFRRTKVDQYILLNTVQDLRAAARWKQANEIRRDKKAAVITKILRFLRQNVGESITGEELRYIASNKTEWARRVRELRTEQGWPVSTKTTGRPDLSIGEYVLEADRQNPDHQHNRMIPDGVRRQVLQRDNYKCQTCGWTHDIYNPSDPRHLELHHIEHHVRGGANTEENLTTLCTVCHDLRHRKEKEKQSCTSV